MKSDYKVFDSDMHCVEPPDLWERYIDDAYKARAPRSSEFAFRNALVYVEVADRIMPWFDPKMPDGRPVPDRLPDPALRAQIRNVMEHQPDVLAIEKFQQARIGDMSRRGWTGEVQLEAMDIEGVDRSVVFPTSGLLVLGVEDIEPDFAAAIARGYNNWLHDYIRADPERLLGAAMIAPHDVEQAVIETRRAVQELGFKAIFMRPNLIRGRHWYDPYYEPLWNTLEELDVPLAFHEGVGVHMPQAGRQFGSNIFLRHVACHSMEMMYVTMAMCGGGVLARHPKLRLGLFEANCGWIPWLLHRMDEHYEIQLGVLQGELPDKPSTFFKRQCFASVEADETFVKQVIEVLGDDNLVFSTDWPHPDSQYPRSVDKFLELPISETSKRKILWDNCARFYGLAS